MSKELSLRQEIKRLGGKESCICSHDKEDHVKEHDVIRCRVCMYQGDYECSSHYCGEYRPVFSFGNNDTLNLPLSKYVSSLERKNK